MAIYAKTLYITDEGTYPLVLNRYTVTINISTNSSDLYGAAITVRLNGNIKEVIYFNGAGQAQYTAREEGAYSFSVTYGSEIISVEKVLGSSDDGKTYPLTINTPLTFDYQSWLNAGNVTGSYSSLEDVLEDEIAIRKLMTIHDAVDFLAGIDADDEGLITILNNDLCAKWITLRDYAEDTLTEAFGTLMTSIGKYGYGEWALMPQVPTMTSDTTPYGEASSYPDNTGTNYAAWKAFNGDISTGWSAYPAAPSVGQYIQYKFSQPTIIKYITYTKNDDDNGTYNYDIKGSNDGNSFTKIGEFSVGTGSLFDGDVYVNNSIAYLYIRIECTGFANESNIGFRKLQFYAWQPKGNVPVMTGVSAPYGSCIITSITGGYGYEGYDDNYSTTMTGTYFGYTFTNPVCVKKYICKTSAGIDVTGGMLQGSNDGTNWTDIAIPSDNNSYYISYRILFSVSTVIAKLQFYGRELKVSVPKMTTDNEPFGEVDASSVFSTFYGWYAFDNNDDTKWHSDSNGNPWLEYDFGYPVVVKLIQEKDGNAYTLRYSIQASNDGFVNDIHDLYVITEDMTPGQILHTIPINNNTAYRYYRWIGTKSSSENYHSLSTLQFFGFDYSEYDWDANNPRYYLYDHGVELETIKEGTGSEGTIEKQSYQIKLATPNSGSQTGNKYAGIFVAKDFTNYNLGRIVMGSINGTSDTSNNYIVDFLIATKDSGVGSNKTMPDQGIAKASVIQPFYSPYNYSLDISSINGEYDIGIAVNYRINRYGTITEWWLE